MSQVKIKKLAGGGTFIIDGQEIKGDDAINAVRSHLGETTGGIMSALQNGDTVSYNSASNQIRIYDNNNTDLTTKYIPIAEKAKISDSTQKRHWQATFNTKSHQFRSELEKLKGVVVKPTVSNSNDLTNLRKGSGWFYTKDSDGNDVYLEGPLNTDRMAMLGEFRKYIEHFGDNGEEASKKMYNTKDWNSDNLRILQNSFAGIKDSNARNEYWSGLINRIKSNQLKDTDKETLRLMGFDDGIAAGGDGKKPVNREKWNSAGFGNLIDLLGQKAHINDDGSLSLNDGESWGWNLGDLSGRNIYFNDNFYQSGYGASGAFDPFRGLTLYNNRLYTLNNPTLAKILNAENGFNALKDAGDWEGADNIILTRFTDAARENPGEFRNDRYSEFLSDHPEYRFTNLTGLYDVEGLNPGEQLIQLYNLDTPLQNNSPYREYAPKYVVLDSKGKWLRDYDNFAGRKIRGTSAKDLITYNRVTSEMGGNPAYVGRYYEDILGKNDEPTGYRVYYNPQNPDEDMILHMPGINAMGIEEDQDIKVPVELGKILIKKFQDKDFLERLVGNAQNKKDFQRFMSELVQSWFRQDSNNDFSRLTWTLPFTETNRKKWKDLGFKGDELDEVMAAWKNAKRNRTAGNREERRYKYLVTSPNIPQEKNGGVINKFQFGGVAGGSTNIKADTTKRVDVKNTNPKNAAGITEIGGSNWTEADTLELGALVADLGSLALAFTPGTNVASAVTGAGASTARFVADKQRGTKGAGLNYLLNLGMDAATLLPIVGGLADANKVVKAVKDALPTIIKAASVYGIGSTVVNSAKKIANGEKWTVRDVSILVNGLTAGVGISRQGGLGKSTKTTKTKGYSESFKVGDKDVTLNNEQITNIMKSKDQAAALKDAITKQAKDASKEEINAALDKLLKPKQTVWQRIRRKEGDVVLNVKKKTNTSTEQLEATGRPLYDWLHGLGDSRAAYNARIIGDKQAWKKANLTKTPGGQKSIQTYWDGKTWHVVKQTTKQVPIAGTESFPSNWAAGSGPIWPTQQITRTTLNPTMSTRTVTRKGGVKFNRNRYNLYDSQSIALPQWINPFTKANYQSNENRQPSGLIYQPIYKNGGKILKGQWGLNTPKQGWQIGWSPNTDFTNLDPTKSTARPWDPEFDSTISLSNNNFNPTEFITNRFYRYSNIPTKQEPEEKTSNINIAGGNDPGGFSEDPYRFNLSPLLDMAANIEAQKANNRYNVLYKKALDPLMKRQFQVHLETEPTYNTSLYEHGYLESVAPYLESKLATNDAFVNSQFNLDKARAISGLKQQQFANISNHISQVDELKRQIRNRNGLGLAEAANQKSALWTGLQNQALMSNAATQATNAASRMQYSNQIRQDIRNAMGNINLNTFNYNTELLMNKEKMRIRQAFQDSYGLEWAGLSDEQKRHYGTIEQYVYENHPEDYTRLSTPDPDFKLNLNNQKARFAKTSFSPIYYKSGGNINIKNTNYNNRSAQDQIAINSAKGTQKHINEISRALLKMLQQLMK